MLTLNTQGKTMQDIVDLLRNKAKETPSKISYSYINNESDPLKTLSYDELDVKARMIAKELLNFSKKGDRVLLLYPQGLEFIEAFFGCLYHGIIAVPA